MLISIFEDNKVNNLTYSEVNAYFKRLSGHTWNDLFKLRLGNKALSKFCKESKFFKIGRRKRSIRYLDPK